PGVLDVIAADYNRDGRPDLIVSNFGIRSDEKFYADRGNLYVLLNQGNGIFRAATKIIGTANPMHLAAGDFDGDGRLDILVNSYHDGVTVLSGDGAGGFVTAQSYATGRGDLSANPVNHNIVLTTAADLNGDGHSDVIMIELGGAIDVRLGRGDGTFD